MSTNIPMKTLTVNSDTFDIVDATARERLDIIESNGIGVGRVTDNNGIVFNDYNNNQAGLNAAAFGEKTKAIGKESFVTGVRQDASGAPDNLADDSEYWRYNEAYGTGSMASGMGAVAYSRASKSLGYRTQTGYPPKTIANAEKLKILEEETDIEIDLTEAISSSGKMLTIVDNHTLIAKLPDEDGLKTSTASLLYDVSAFKGLMIQPHYSWSTESINMNDMLDMSNTNISCNLILIDDDNNELSVDYSEYNNNTSNSFLIPSDHTILKIVITASCIDGITYKVGITFTAFPADNRGQAAMAIGSDTIATENNSFAGGHKSQALNKNAMAFGVESKATGSGAIALGRTLDVSGNNAFACGAGNTSSGTASMALGSSTQAIADYTLTAGYQTQATNTAAVALGYESKATGDISIALGALNEASGSRAIALGNGSQASEKCAIAMGDDANAQGQSSFAAGDRVTAVGNGSIVIGTESSAHTDGSISLGGQNDVTGYKATAIGCSNESNGLYSVAIGYNAVADGDYSFASGGNNIASGTGSTAMGINNQALGAGSFVAGNHNITIDNHAYGQTIFGRYNQVDENAFFIIGNGISVDGRKNIFTINTDGTTKISGNLIVNGTEINATNLYSFTLFPEAQVTPGVTRCLAAGYKAQSTVKDSIALGREAVASEKQGAIAIGYQAKASGQHSFAAVRGVASGAGAISLGAGNESSGANSFTANSNNTASYLNSTAFGTGNKALAENQFVMGRYNLESYTDLFIVGNGNSTTRSNAFVVDRAGNAKVAQSMIANGADYAEMFEWLDANPENEDRIGYVVTLDGDKIRFADKSDEILGIISSTAAILGDSAEMNWRDKYITDKFGRIQHEQIAQFEEEIDPNTGEVNQVFTGYIDTPIVNPNYNDNETYVPRTQRKEWACVGMFGKLRTRDDGTCQVNGYAKVDKNGILTAADTKTNMRVLKRIDIDVVQILLK